MEQTMAEMNVVRTSSRRDGTPISQEVKNLCQLDDTLRSYFNIGAQKIVITYDTIKVEWALVPELTNGEISQIGAAHSAARDYQDDAEAVRSAWRK